MNVTDRRRMITKSRSTQSELKNIREFDLILHFMFGCLQAVQFPVVEKQKKMSSTLRCNGEKSLPIESGCAGTL